MSILRDFPDVLPYKKGIHLRPCFTIRYNKVLDKLKVDSDDLGSDLFNVK